MKFGLIPTLDFQNGYIIFPQEESKINFSHYLEFNVTTTVEYGKGTIKGDKVEYKEK